MNILFLGFIVGLENVNIFWSLSHQAILKKIDSEKDELWNLRNLL